MALITREGYPTLIIIALASVLLSVLTGLFYPPGFYFVLFLSLILFLIVLNFFRDPERISPAENHLVLSPADGKIIRIQNVTDDRYMKGEARLVSIFMNVFNVHVNRNPVSGTVTHAELIPGKFLSAYKDEAQIQNEQAVIGIKSEHGMIFFKQIAGLVARRVVCRLESGQFVRAGERMGMIKFGSRLDVLMPLQAEIKVKLGDSVKSGISVIATFNKP